METKTKYCQKTLFTKIYEEHRDNLFSKNYSEKMIDSWSEHGLFFKQLHAAFKQAYITDVEVFQIRRFQLEISGFFSLENRDGSKTKKDKVKFEFSYAYDPARIELKLTELKATMNDQFEKSYPVVLHPSKDLPAAGTAFKELFAIREKELLEKVQTPKKAPNNSRKMRR
jgi:hypothetical protein